MMEGKNGQAGNDVQVPRDLSRLKEFGPGGWLEEIDRDANIEEDMWNEVMKNEKEEQAKGKEWAKEQEMRERMEQEQGERWMREQWRREGENREGDDEVHESVWMNDDEWKDHLEREIKEEEVIEGWKEKEELVQRQAWEEVMMDEQHSEYDPGIDSR